MRHWAAPLERKADDDKKKYERNNKRTDIINQPQFSVVIFVCLCVRENSPSHLPNDYGKKSDRSEIGNIWHEAGWHLCALFVPDLFRFSK